MPSRSPTYVDAVRAVTMLRLLATQFSQSMPLDELATALGVSTRTVQRYVDAIGAAIVTEDNDPLVTRAWRDGRPRVMLGGELPAASATVYQYATVWAASRWLSVGGSPLFGDSATNMLDAFGAASSDEKRKVFQRVHASFHYVPFGPKDMRAHEDVLDVMAHAVIHHRPVDITRKGRDGAPYTERIEPYTLVLYRDGLYVVARVPSSQAVRIFALERLEDATLDRHSTFDKPESYDPAAYFEDRLGLWQPTTPPDRVEIAFNANVAKVASQRRWPGGGEWFDLPDGRRCLRMQLAVTPEVVTWVVGWGPEAEALSPPSLRRDVASLLRKSASQYADVDLDAGEVEPADVFDE